MSLTSRTISVQTHSAKGEGRILSLDGLRGVAIILVLLVHFTPDVTIPIRSLEWIRKSATAGWVGVDLFFVLSGFLITGILLRAKGAEGYFRSFYLRRVLRIFPLYYGTLIMVFFVFPLVGAVRWSTFQSLWDNQHWHWLYATNFAWWIEGRAAASADWVDLRHFWSLAVEEHFYFIWPTVVFFINERKLKWVCLSCVLGAFLLRTMLALKAAPPAMFCLTPCRVDALAIGAFLAVAFEEGWLSDLKKPARLIAFLMAGWLGLFFLIKKGLWTGHWLILTAGLSSLGLLFGSLLVQIITSPGSKIERIMRNPLLIFFGKYSYGLYVIHALVAPIVERVLPLSKLIDLTNSIVISIVSLFLVKTAVSVLIAVFSWHCYENHFLKLKKHFPYRKPGHRSWLFDSQRAT